MTIKLIVGLGNSGHFYNDTRHNFGSKYVKFLAKKYEVILEKNKKLSGYIGQFILNNNTIKLLIPNCYMNNSGFSVFKCMNAYKLSIDNLLIVHDDLDLLPGKIRIKLGKNYNDTHQGLRNIVLWLNNMPNFYRLRIGIGRPNDKKISDFVLDQPSEHEKSKIINVMHETIHHTENIILKKFVVVMNKLHSCKNSF